MIWIHRSFYIFFRHLLSKIKKLLVKQNRRGAHNFCLSCIYIRDSKAWSLVSNEKGGKLFIQNLLSRLNRHTRWKRCTPYHTYNPHSLKPPIPLSQSRYSSPFYQSLLAIASLHLVFHLSATIDKTLFHEIWSRLMVGNISAFKLNWTAARR